MRAAALLAVAASAGVVSAKDAVLNEAPKEALQSLGLKKAPTPLTEQPTYAPYALKAPFFEQFDDLSRWKRSTAKKDMAGSEFEGGNKGGEPAVEEWQFTGNWANEEPTVYPGIVGDKGLVLKDKAHHHAISAMFDKPIDNKDNTLVVQYEVKLQNGLECGGAYMKLLQDNKSLQTDEFSNGTPYIIMFGPDKCGSTNKVHFIFRHKNPKTGEYEEKHLIAPPRAEITKSSTLYTLIVQPDQTYEILINGKSESSGSLLENFEPSVNPPKEIPDENDEKPADWVDVDRIPDPKSKKPADWDENAPFEIPDKKAKKPADWLDDEPATIPDPESSKPEDWDDEEDGDWIAPQVPNPKCEDISGCGPWTAPMIKNPDYKGEWRPDYIDNPAYKGEWEPRNIPNPDYYEDKTPANFEPMGAIGFELWTMQDDILFDNIYIGHSIADAKKLEKEIFDLKFSSEEAQEEAAREAEEDEADLPTPLSELSFMEDPMEFLKTKFDLFLGIAKRDPLEAVKTVPEIAGILGVGVVTLFALLSGAFAGGAKAAPSAEELKAKANQAKEAAKKAAGDAQDSVASGVDKAKDELNKRTTRSQG